LRRLIKILVVFVHIQGDFESCADILITSYWLHVELGKKYLKNSISKNKYALKLGNRIDVRFIKYDIQGVFLKCAEILPTRLFDNVEA
jgi:hypothetical protein